MFYTFRTLVNSPVGVLGAASDPVGTITTSLEQYAANAKSDLIATWSIWIPAHVLTFGVIPSHLRMVWIAFVSFSYVCVLSAMRGAKQVGDGESEDEDEDNMVQR